MVFSDDLIRAIVKTGEFSDPAAEKYLGDVLIQRRDKIGRAYLTKINPVVDPTLDASGVLSFGNAAVQSGVTSAPRGYTAAWHTFDNATGESRPLGQTTGAQSSMKAPAGLPGATGVYIRVDISADHPDHSSWKEPVRAYFQRQSAGWKLVGLERLPDSPQARPKQETR